MWLKLEGGSSFNTSVARALKVGAASAAEDANWAVIAVMPHGEELPLVQFHLPQAAQDVMDSIFDGIGRGKKIMDLS
jgi:hypothetical protein